MTKINNKNSTKSLVKEVTNNVAFGKDLPQIQHEQDLINLKVLLNSFVDFKDEITALSTLLMQIDTTSRFTAELKSKQIARLIQNSLVSIEETCIDVLNSNNQEAL